MKRLSRPLHRRQLLTGLGFGLPFLTRYARAATAQGNFCVFYTPDGHRRSLFGATGNDDTFSLKASLKPLEPFQAKVSMLQDLDNPGASTKKSHEDCVRTLTCVPGGDLYTAQGPSIDWVIAQGLGQRPLTVSALWPQAPNWQTKISWKAKGQFDPHVDNAKTSFNDLFSDFVPPTAGAVRPLTPSTIVAQRKSVLDFVREDVSTFMTRVPAAEKVKLATHLEALREVEKKINQPAMTIAPATCTPGTTKSRTEAGTAGLTGGEELRVAIEIQMDLIATAFACGSRRVATLLTQGASAGRNPFGGVNHHDVSHFMGVDPLGTWARIDQWYAERFAYFLKRLQDLGILDTTAVVWATEISEDHSQEGFVIPIAGGQALGLRGRRSFGKNNLSNLWVSVAKAMGQKIETFGTASSGGIPGLYVPV